MIDVSDVVAQTDKRILLYYQVQLLNLLNSYHAIEITSALTNSKILQVPMNNLQEMIEKSTPILIIPKICETFGFDPFA